MRVGGGYNYRVLETGHPAEIVGEPAVVENLQEKVKYVRKRFFKFVEENQAVWLLKNGIGKRAAHFAVRRAYESLETVLALVFRHIESYH